MEKEKPKLIVDISQESLAHLKKYGKGEVGLRTSRFVDGPDGELKMQTKILKKGEDFDDPTIPFEKEPVYKKPKRIKKEKPLPLYKRQDPRYIGVPNISFSRVDDESALKPKYVRQRKKRGFDDWELWDLSDAIIDFIAPRLEAFEKYNKKVWCGGKNKRHTSNVEKMAKAFVLLKEDRDDTEEDRKIIKTGLRTFARHFQSLWI